MKVFEMSIAELFPYYFKLEAWDLPWYESMEFEKSLSSITPELEEAARELLLIHKIIRKLQMIVLAILVMDLVGT